MYINPKKKAKLIKKRQKEETFIRNYPSLYRRYIGRGFTHQKAVYYMKKELSKKAKTGTKTLEKLKTRYDINLNKPGVVAISLQDIKRTKAVEDWVNDMVKDGKVIDKGYQLEFR